MSLDFSAEFTQQRLRQRSHSHPRRGFSGARPLQNIARVVKIIFDRSRQISMSGTRPGERFLLIFRALRVFHRQSLGPISPIFVANDDSDGRPDGFRMSHSSDDFDAIGLNFHAAAAAVTLLTAPEVM